MSRGALPRRRATLASLAAELNVSRTTISNAYNRPDQLSADLRERVLAAAKEMGYSGPDPVARSLRTRKAGAVVSGASKVEAAVKSGKALAVIHAADAADDGVRKLAQVRRRAGLSNPPEVPAYKLFLQAELGLALGGTNVIHAAVLAGDPGKAAVKRMVALDRYRGGPPDDRTTVAAVAAEDTE